MALAGLGSCCRSDRHPNAGLGFPPGTGRDAAERASRTRGRTGRASAARTRSRRASPSAAATTAGHACSRTPNTRYAGSRARASPARNRA